MLQIALYLAIGLGIGLVSGALGIGGGVLMVPLLIYCCNFSFTKARATSLAVLVMPVVLPGVWKYFRADSGSVDPAAALCIAVAFAVGGFLGAGLATQQYIPIPESQVKLCFGLVMLFIAMRYIVSTDSDAANAAAGICSTVVALVVYAVLRSLGRRHITRPNLGKKIQEMAAQDQGGPDYSI